MATKIVNMEKNKCWINGNEFLGIAEEGSVEAKRKLADYDGFGMIAPIKVSMGKLEEITAKIKLKLTDITTYRELSKNRGFIDLRMSGQATVFNSTRGYVKDDTITTRIRGTVEEIPIPTHKDGEIPAKDFTVHVWFLEVSHNGSVILKVDVSSGEIIPRDLV